MTHNMVCFTHALRPLTLHFPSGLRSTTSGLRSTTIPTPRLLHLPRRASIAKARGSAQPQRTTSSCTSSPARCAARRPGRSCSSVSDLRAKQRPACGGGAHDRWPFQSLRWHRRLQYGVPHAHAQNDSSPQPSHLQRNAKGKGQLHTAHSTQHTAHSTQHTAHSAHRRCLSAGKHTPLSKFNSNLARNEKQHRNGTKTKPKQTRCGRGRHGAGSGTMSC